MNHSNLIDNVILEYMLAWNEATDYNKTLLERK